MSKSISLWAKKQPAEPGRSLIHLTCEAQKFLHTHTHHHIHRRQIFFQWYKVEKNIKVTKKKRALTYNLFSSTLFMWADERREKKCFRFLVHLKSEFDHQAYSRIWYFFISIFFQVCWAFGSARVSFTNGDYIEGKQTRRKFIKHRLENRCSLVGSFKGVLYESVIVDVLFFVSNFRIAPIGIHKKKFFIVPLKKILILQMLTFKFFIWVILITTCFIDKQKKEENTYDCVPLTFNVMTEK